MLAGSLGIRARAASTALGAWAVGSDRFLCLTQYKNSLCAPLRRGRQSRAPGFQFESPAASLSTGREKITGTLGLPGCTY